MPFTFSKVLDHGTTNPIVARLTLQIRELLDQCEMSEKQRDDVFDVYLNSLVRKLVRCWEIETRFKQGFDSAVDSFQPPEHRSKARTLPQIDRLEEECHDFLYAAKNYIRDVLKVFNLLHGTSFADASEFSRPKKGKTSLVQFSEATFGEKDSRSRFFRGAVGGIKEIVDMRNAVEHPEGYSGELKIQNISVGLGGQLAEPVWFRTAKGSQVTEPSAIRTDLAAIIGNLLALGEGVVVSWAANNLAMPQMMQVAQIPEGDRNPSCPIAWRVGLNAAMASRLVNTGKRSK